MNRYTQKFRFFILYSVVLLIGGVIFFKTGCFFMGALLSVIFVCLVYAFYLNHNWYRLYKNTRRQIANMPVKEKYRVIRQNEVAWSSFATDEEIAELCREFFRIDPNQHNKEELRDIFSKCISEKVSL